MKKFNIRVYGLLINDNQLLVTQENIAGKLVTKLPGGGLEFGEGIKDCLKRELKEELSIEVEIINHFYTTDFFVPSLFDDSQVISIYYFISCENKLQISVSKDEKLVQNFNWIPLNELSADLFNFPIDKHVINLVKSTCNH
jgi:mutator protein MutT